jgi:hypothetical protein
MQNADNDNGFPFLDSFYYLAPLWFVVETFFWPNFRAGLVFGAGHAGTAAFYAIEAGIGAALWFRLPHTAAGALLENVIYLVFVLKFILYAPLDAAAALGDGVDVSAEFSRTYSAALPGMLYSALHVIFRIKKQIAGQRPG